MKRYLITAVKFALSIAILWYLINKARQDNEFSEVLSNQKNWWWLAGGFLACLSAHLFAFVRWRIMVRALGLPFRLLDAIRIGFIGLFFNLFAFGVIGGDTLRAFYVTREIPSRKPEAIASVIADRMIGLLTMFLVASVAFLFLDTSAMGAETENVALLRFLFQVVVAATVAGLAALAFMFFTPRLTKKKWFRKLVAIPVAGAVLMKVVAVIKIYRNRPKALAVCFLLSIAVNICFMISIYAIASGLYSDVPSLANHCVIEPIAMVANAVPLPGGVGGMEFVLDFLYRSLGNSHGVVVAFTFRFALLLVSAIGAFVWFLNRSKVDGLIPEEKNNIG